MASNGGLTASPLRSDLSFNWVFLVELIVCGIVTLFFLFYFNRVFATLVSYGLRAWTWHQYRVYIDIQALQISLLGGRVFFKGVRYHGNNETILIHNGFITWTYWLRDVKELNIAKTDIFGKRRVSTDYDNDRLDDGSEPVDGGEKGRATGVKKKLPCRINVTLDGVEWFVYNRSPAYDAIITGIAGGRETFDNDTNIKGDDPNGHARLRKRGVASDLEKAQDMSKESMENSHRTTSNEEKPNVEAKSDRSLPHHRTVSNTPSDEVQDTEPAFLLRFLPVHIKCTKAALVLGNENTKSVLIAKVDGASGELDASGATHLDQYRQLINFSFEHPVIQMKPNDDFKEDQNAAASRIKRGGPEQADSKHTHTHSFFHRQRRKAWHTVQDLVPYFRSSVESFSSSLGSQPESPVQTGPGTSSWQGLSRYLDETEQDDKARWSSIEYATVTTIADSPRATMSFYWDVPGKVPKRFAVPESMHDNINGDVPPEWGIDLLIEGAIINYGPWADRQRADIQRVFFPSLCKDASPGKKLVAGDYRVPTEFKLYVEFDHETTLRIPIREESKNWKWAKQADTMGARQSERKRNNKNRRRKSDKGTPGPEVRPFGWIDIKVGANATVRYMMDMIAGDSGFSNKIQLDLPNIEITTSVNHGLLWRSSNNTINCDLSNPLQWNGLRTWNFDIGSRGLELFILREHIFLITDLVDDWATGPPPDYLTFSPFRYMVNLNFQEFKLYLNVNDANIINNPADFDDNTFIIIFGKSLTADVCIPIDKFRPHRNEIQFGVVAKHGGLNLHVPPWNTQATFLNSTEIAQLGALDIKGKYQYCATTSSSNTDTLLLDVHGNAATAQFYGFVIRYYLKIKDNYFGDDIRFKTLEEHQEFIRTKTANTNETVNVQPLKKSNDLDVILSVSAEESSVILPANLYSAKNHVQIDIPTLSADLRFTNYYMDLDVDLSTLAFSLGTEDDGGASPISATSGTQLFVDGVKISGNRLFGLPPAEPTYVCNWDFTVGAVTGECTSDFLVRLIGGVKALAFSFDDDENALPPTSAILLHDVTFLRAAIESIRIWVHVEEAAFLLSSSKITLNFDDWAGSHYSKKMDLQIPDLNLGCVDAESASRHRSRSQHPVETHALVQTSISFGMIQKKLDFVEDRRLQQEHVKRHDRRTHRTDFLLHDFVPVDIEMGNIDPPAMSVPPMPLPLTFEHGHDEGGSLTSKSLSMQRQKTPIGRKSSFLTTSSLSQRSNRSILRTRSLRREEASASLSRSRSLQTGGSQLRDLSVSTGRQSSFYSAIGEPRGLPPSSVTFSSSYIAPYFPLEAVEPDSKDLPIFLPESRGHDAAQSNSATLGEIQPNRVGKNAAHTSFIIEMPHGVKAMCSPNAVGAVAGLLTAVQNVDPVDIIDELQITSMSEIFSREKKEKVCGEVLDIAVRTPNISLRFLNSSLSQDFENPQEETHDQYDFSLSRLALALRNETIVTNADAGQSVRQSSAFHMSLGSVGIAARERFGGIDDPQAAVNGVLDDVVFWIASGDKIAANAIFKTIQFTTVSNKIEYLASLVHRTSILATHIQETFTSRIKQQQNRVQLFTYLVATAGEHATDPLFLTRPSYVLRSAEKHLRTHDSWKIIARLRHMYTILGKSSRLDIANRCLINTEIVPEDAAHRVLASLSQWRSWDFNNLGNCVIMSNVFGLSTDGVSIPVSKALSMNFSFRTELIRLMIDPGPKQNEIALSSITASASITAGAPLIPLSVPAIQQTADLNVQNIMLQVFCEDVSVNLNWELYELAKDILKLYQPNEPAKEPSEIPPHIQQMGTHSKLRRNVQIVVATGKGSITLDTINVRAVCISEGLKISTIMTEDAGDNIIANAMIAADATTSKVQSHSQVLSIYQLRQPSVYISYEKDATKNIHTNTFKVAANSQELSFVVQQDVLALLDILDLIIGDEVAQLHQLMAKLPKKPHSQPMEPSNILPANISEPVSVNKINIALFLDMYNISIPLLQSLTYNISGVVARASLAAHFGSEIVFDFDVKEHSHDIQTILGSERQSISLLHMPPTNGRIISNMFAEENTISVFASVEPVKVDAAAVHSLLTALNRPEISSVVTDIRDDIKAIQAHIEEIFGPKLTPTPKSPPAASHTLVYDIHLTFAGLDVYANAQASRSDQTTARLDFNIGCVQLSVANRLEPQGPIHELPELRINLHSILFELSRLNNGNMESCGNLAFAAFLTATSKKNEIGDEVRSFHLMSNGLDINLFAETASSVVDVMGHLQDKIKDIDLSREKQYFKRFRKSRPKIAISDEQKEQESISGSTSTMMFSSMYSLEFLKIQVSWLVANTEDERASHGERENLVLSLKRIELSTRKENTARLAIEDLQLQMVPASHDKIQRSLNSALLPEVIFNVGYVSTSDTRRMVFQAAGKSLDLRLTSQFIIPAAELKRSIGSAADKVRAATATWRPAQTLDLSSTAPATRRKPFFGKKRMEHLHMNADFAGAVVYLSGKKLPDIFSTHTSAGGRVPQAGKYGQFTHTDTGSNTVLRAPGLAWNVTYKDNGLDDPSLNVEVKVDASSNILYPAVVPLILEMSSTIKEIVSEGDDDKSVHPKPTPQKFIGVDEDNILTADPSTVLGRTKLNLGLRICKQEFTLSCQPIARVAATARFDEIYMTVNTVRSTEHGHFFAASVAFSKLQASVQHVYSRESTGSFDVESIFLSLMNSKHVSGTSGMSAILKISPMKVLVNAKQLQDFLLFREIWVPVEMRQGSAAPVSSTDNLQSSTFLVQRYQQVAATGAFPWNAIVSIAELDVQLDLGQAIGKSAFIISNFWISSKKNSDWEQNLCLGFDKIGVDSSGRMSGFVALQDFKVRTSIQWPAREKALNQTPLVQGSLNFSKLRVKAAFDYQAFLVADITTFEFLMYNVRNSSEAKGDRLVAILDGDSVQIFCTTTTASQALALYQAFERLVQEKKSNYETSLAEIERFMKRKSVSHPLSPLPKASAISTRPIKATNSPISLHTDVIITLKAVNVGAFPSTFSDHQVFKLEALDAQARFAVTMDQGKIHSILGLTLGQLRIGLAGVKQVEAPKSVSEISVEDVVNIATSSRGGTILKVPKVEATMQTWQVPDSNHIDYIFKSSFEGKVEVGWNYSRVSYIRSMYATHTKALAQKLGKPLPPSALKITGVPNAEDPSSKEGEQQKITAEVNVPLSKYDYTALEPPIIETPLLQSLGEATPPLEFFGLHRDRLPNLTHQIVIVALLELAGEVEDAYGKILGSS